VNEFLLFGEGHGHGSEDEIAEGGASVLAADAFLTQPTCSPYLWYEEFKK
jgi:hypothetical protein